MTSFPLEAEDALIRIAVDRNHAKAVRNRAAGA
jgi:hypothetical protein